jgi:hypothetical protein
MFDGTFGGLDPAQLAALTSCLVPVERSNVRGPPPLGAVASRLSRPTRLCSVTAAWILFRLWLASVLARCLRVCLRGPATVGRACNSLLSPQSAPPSEHRLPPHCFRRLQEQVRLSAQLAGPLRALQDAARRVAEVSSECKLEVDAGGLRLLRHHAALPSAAPPAALLRCSPFPARAEGC